MKLAVFDHQLNYGGGKRFLSNLLCSLVEVDKNLEIHLFCKLENSDKSNNFNELTERGILVRSLKSLEYTDLQPNLIYRGGRFISRKLGLNFLKDKEVKEELSLEITEISKDFDIAYFPWPYLLNCPKTYCPKVATFHDFNFKYFFGSPLFSPDQLNFINGSFVDWMNETTPVVSTNFMKDELLQFYPKVNDVNVVHLSSLNMYQSIDSLSDEVFDYQYLLDKPYIVLAAHLCPHKNIGNVIAATSLINKNKLNFRLVLTGQYTGIVKGKSSYLGLQNQDIDENEVEQYDIIGLGYITDVQMNFLLRKAFAVINPSLYEAGNGVGLDAWPLGIPVIQSNIPAFEEHLELQGLKAFTFDPRNVHSIAEAIQDCFSNEDKRKKFVKDSLEAFKNMKWESTAKKYNEIFKSKVKSKIKV